MNTGDMMMASFLATNHIHPINIAEEMAEEMQWPFNRIDAEKISMLMPGVWCNYSLNLFWSEEEGMLHLIMAFYLSPNQRSIGKLCRLLNEINGTSLAGDFHYHQESLMILWRYSLILDGADCATPEQIDKMVEIAHEHCEKFYPAFQLVISRGITVEQALHVAIDNSYGRA